MLKILGEVNKKHMILSLVTNRIMYIVAKRFTKKVLFAWKIGATWLYFITGCARRGASGALFPKSALCGAEFPLKGFTTGWKAGHYDRPPCNRRSWISSGPEGSSDKWCGLCRGLFPIFIMAACFRKKFDSGCTTISFFQAFNPS